MGWRGGSLQPNVSYDSVRADHKRIGKYFLTLPTALHVHEIFWYALLAVWRGVGRGMFA